jgi:hypothetical protein
MANRKAVTEFIVSSIAQIIPGETSNAELTKKFLDGLSDTEFDNYIRSLARPEDPDQEHEQEILPYFVPNFKDPRVTLDGLMELADTLGIVLFERIWLTDPQTGETYLTPHKYPISMQLIRRQAQTLTKKSSIPENTRHVDELTGQVTGKSKGSKISFPELQAQLSQGLEMTLMEEIKVRGGDRAAQVEFDRQLIETGEASLDEVTEGTGVTKSTSVVSILLRGMLMDNNIDEV